MVVRANIKEAFRSLATARQRTLLALIGIVIGIGSVIGMVSIGQVVQNEVLKQFKDMGIDIVRVGKELNAPGRGGQLRLSDILESGQYIPEVAQVAPYIMSSAQYHRGMKKTYITLMGVTESFFVLNKLALREGRFISDLDAYRYFCVIGADTARFLAQTGTADPIGSRIRLNDRIYTIAGVLQRVPSGGGMRPSGINQGALVHITTGSRVFAQGEINEFLARINGDPEPVQLNHAFREYFEKRSRGINVRVWTAEEMIESMKKQMRLFTLLLGAIGSISLIVGGVGVMNVMLVSVSERRREIGIRRALGAQKTDIQGQFIIESVALCLAGGLIGIMLGIAVSYFFARFTGWQFLVSYTAIVLGVCVSSLVGVFFGFYPARSAAGLDPIEALKT